MTIEVLDTGNVAKQFVTAILNILLMTGCSISVPQAESSYSFLKGLIPSDEASMQEQQATWLASVGDRGAVLHPYLGSGLTVFANADGDAISFDGWTIRSIVGFGLERPLSISGKDGARTFTDGGQKMLATCDEWKLTGLTWRQTCSNGLGEIVLDGEGNIVKITMAISNRSAIVTLRVVK